MFRRQGATVTMAKNRLREDAVNFVFGAHLGFPADWQDRHGCIFVNLEQLGQGGASVSPDYLALLRRSAVVDYDAANVGAYAQDAADVPIVSFGYAAYLDKPALALEERPIDLLFFGSTNARRQQFIARVEAAGFNVAMFDGPVYGPERDDYIRQAKAVLNCHYYESNRFEQARAFHCLSLGTPVISEYTPSTDPAPAFRDAVLWLPGQVEEWFRLHFRTPAFYDEARKRLAAFRSGDATHDPMAQFADLLAFAEGFRQGFARVRVQGPWRPRAINLGSGKDYKPTWLNVDSHGQAEPDLVLDLARPLALPHATTTRMGGEVLLEAGALELIQAGNVLAHAPELPLLMTNALALLKAGGALSIELPCGKGPASALDESAWAPYCERFWQAGWFEHRFELARQQWLDAGSQPCAREAAAVLRVVLRKLATTPRERTTARMMRADFGGLDDDQFAAADAFALT
jgi:hypothetical protein